MKNFLTLFLLAVSVLFANGRTFEVKVLNTPTINIGDKNLKVGNLFDENDTIFWSSDNQAMKVLSDDNKVYILSHKLFDKLNVKSFADYITSVESTSVRAAGEDLPISLDDHKANFEGDFVLLDSISVIVGWKSNENSFFVAKTTNLGDSNFMFIIPCDKNTLTIDREICSQLPPDCDFVRLSIGYFEREYNEFTHITDSMNIEIVPIMIND